jgi:hypothetical protein
VGFEATIPVFERVKTVHALDRAAAVIGLPPKLGISIGFKSRPGNHTEMPGVLPPSWDVIGFAIDYPYFIIRSCFCHQILVFKSNSDLMLLYEHIYTSF